MGCAYMAIVQIPFTPVYKIKNNKLRKKMDKHITILTIYGIAIICALVLKPYIFNK